MSTWEDVRRIALDLPLVEERDIDDGLLQWRVKDRGFAWERPLRQGDIEALGEDAPDGPILGVRTPDIGVKEALIAENPRVYFTTPHFNGYPAVLVQLDHIKLRDLEELVVEAWLTRAPRRVAKEYLASRP